MPTVEKRLVLTKGPPWGFRLYLDGNGALTISKIRRHSPAESGNLHSGDQIITLNGRPTAGMSHVEAVNFIDTTIGSLDMVVSRFEAVSTHVMTKCDQIDASNMDTVKAKMHLDFKRNEDSPEVLKVPSCTPEVEIEMRAPEPIVLQDVVIPFSPDVQPISISKLTREYMVPEEPYCYVPKKKHFTDSAFYHDPQNLYPTTEEKVDMARRVALSLTAPDNKNSKGASIFERQRKRAEKYTLNKNDDEPAPKSAIDSARYDLDHWPQVMEPREKSPSPIFRLGYSTKQHVPPPPPPPPPSNETKTIQEFMEKVQKFPKTKHTEITPQVCFDIAAALHTSDSRGAQIFAQKKNRSKKWELPERNAAEPQPLMAKCAENWNDSSVRMAATSQKRPTPRVISVVRNNTVTVNSRPNINYSSDNSVVQPRKPAHVIIRRNSNQTPQEPTRINNPISMSSQKTMLQSQPKEVSQQAPAPNQWKPVKFNIPQKA